MKALVLAMALGQTHPAPAKAVPSTKVIFGIDEIDGGRRGPDVLVVRAPQRSAASSLIQLREDFRHEVLASSADLK